jgi:hypothetical protein
LSDDRVPQFVLQVGDDGAFNVREALLDRLERVGTARPESLCARMPSTPSNRLRTDVCAVCLGRFQQVERDGRIGAIAVEKVVRPENHPPFVQLQTTDRLGDPAAVFLEADRTGVPAAAGNRDHTGSGFERRADRGVLVERASDRVET